MSLIHCTHAPINASHIISQPSNDTSRHASSILPPCCRATKPIWGKGRGELVWLTQPDGYFDKHIPPQQQQQSQHHQPQEPLQQPEPQPQEQEGSSWWLQGVAGRVASFLRGDGGGKAGHSPSNSDGSGPGPASGLDSSSSSTSSAAFRRHDPATPSPTPFHYHDPWEETVLAEGPDVMFEVVDLDPTDDQLEVVRTIHQLIAVVAAAAVDIIIVVAIHYSQ